MNTEKNDLIEFFGDVISSYSSEQAEQDGILISTGHPLINYITHTIYSKCIEPFSIDGMWEQFAPSKEKYERKLISKLIESTILEIQKQYLKANKKEDWFYSVEVRGWELFVSQNETGKFTLLFPSDY